MNNGKTFEPPRRNRLFSPITNRILAINVLALVILVAGILFLDEYEANLIDAELASLGTQAEMFAVALAENAATPDRVTGHYRVSDVSDQMVRRLVNTTGARARLFVNNGRLIADSQNLIGSGGGVQVEELPPIEHHKGWLAGALDWFDRASQILPGKKKVRPYTEPPFQTASDYPEVISALRGEYIKSERSIDRDHLYLIVAVPVQRYKQILGGLMLSKKGRNVEAAMYDVRLNILRVFSVALSVTVLLSIYLAGTIARPIRRLALAADQIRHNPTRQSAIPGFSGRNDEIGELAETLNQMTEALHQRMDAIESFAADVAHEIKNPLTSLRSAVETTARLKDPEQQRKLMTIIQEDVVRLDRLISDISDASRLDAELSRAQIDRVNITGMLETLVDIADTTQEEGLQIKLQISQADNQQLFVNGMDGRLAQVFRNLIANAISFSPTEGIIQIHAWQQDNHIHITIDDDGPGIPVGKEGSIFERFYSERPDTEKFGTHSGLGLSISKQIILAHEGSIIASTRKHDDGTVAGARFTVILSTD